MGTLSDMLSSVRIRIKDKNKNEFTDEELITLTVELMDQVYEALRRMESNLVIKTSTFNTVANITTYTFSGATDYIPNWRNLDTPALELLMAPLETMDPGQPVYYTILPSGEVTLTPTPDDVYVVSITNCEQYTPPTVATMDTYDFPWAGIWNRFILRSLVLECLSILERSVGVAAAQAGSAHDEAVIATYTHGVVRRTRKGRLFNGI